MLALERGWAIFLEESDVVLSHRKVDNVARVPIVIGLTPRSIGRRRERARLFGVHGIASLSPPTRSPPPPPPRRRRRGCSGLKRLRPTHVRG